VLITRLIEDDDSLCRRGDRMSGAQGSERRDNLARE
jgi:hypothetical protein